MTDTALSSDRIANLNEILKNDKSILHTNKDENIISVKTFNNTPIVQVDNGNYSEGLRINKSVDGLALLMLGTDRNTKEGMSGWALACDKQGNFVCNNVNSTAGSAGMFIDKSSNLTVKGTITAPLFKGEAQYARWGDLAEVYDTDKEYPKGTLLDIGGKKEVTIATKDVKFVVSSKPGVVLNKFSSGQELALTGRVPVRVIGKVSKGDQLYLSKDLSGVACKEKSDITLKIFALEDKTTEEEDLVNCLLK